jgi:hypothetical protein
MKYNVRSLNRNESVNFIDYTPHKYKGLPLYPCSTNSNENARLDV